MKTKTTITTYRYAQKKDDDDEEVINVCVHRLWHRPWKKCVREWGQAD